MRQRPYATIIHKLGKTVNGVARELEVTGQTLRAHLRGEPKRLGADKQEKLAGVLNLKSRRELDGLINRWMR